jgi:hypothetical protein
LTDAQLVQVVALIDSLAERGAVDALIAPLRLRIGGIHPPRPLRFTRLLFLPLDPVVVPAQLFRVGTPTVPRTALTPFAAEVQTALGTRVADINAAIAKSTVEDTDTVLRVGAVLWPEAAAILARGTLPHGWIAAGLPPGLHPALARGIAAVLDQAVVLQEIVDEATVGLPLNISVLDAVWANAAGAGPNAWRLTLAALLGRLRDPDAVLRHANAWTARRGDHALRVAFDIVSETQIARLESSDDATDGAIAVPDLATAGAKVHRLVGLLDELGCETASTARRARLRAIRGRLDASCHARFAEGLADEFIAPLQQFRRATDPDAPQQLEATARQLRNLEIAGRRLGSAAAYDALLRQAAATVRDLAPDAGLTLIDRIRLIEILAGPEEASALLP